jgi:hypothetical protein
MVMPLVDVGMGLNRLQIQSAQRSTFAEFDLMAFAIHEGTTLALWPLKNEGVFGLLPWILNP